MVAEIVDNPAPLLKGDGRNGNGQFVKGQYKGGPGNRISSKVQRFRHALLKAVTQDDIDRVMRRLITLATADDADVSAIKEFFDRTIGKSTQPIEMPGELGGIRIEVVYVDARGNSPD